MGRFLFFTGGILLFIFSLLFLDKLILDLMIYLQLPELISIMKVVSFIGKGYILFVITSLIYVIAQKRKGLYTNALIFGTVTVVVYLIKIIVNKGRPESILIDETDSSFPSGHASYVFGALPLIELEFPKYSWIFMIFAILDVTSRLYLRAHYLSDVVFGILLGYTISLLFIYFQRSLVTTKVKV